MLNVTADLKYGDFYTHTLHFWAKTALKMSDPSLSKLGRSGRATGARPHSGVRVAHVTCLSPSLPPQRPSAPGSQCGGSGCFGRVKKLLSCWCFLPGSRGSQDDGPHHLKACPFWKEGVGGGWLGAAAPPAMTLFPRRWHQSWPCQPHRNRRASALSTVEATRQAKR